MFQSINSLGYLLPKTPKLPLLYFVRHKPFPLRRSVPFSRSRPITDTYSLSKYGSPHLSFSEAMNGLRAYSLVDFDEVVRLKMLVELFSPKKKKQLIQTFNSLVAFPHKVSENATTVFVICHPDEVETVQACGADGFLDTNSLERLGEEIIKKHEFFLSTVRAFDFIRPLLGQVLKSKMPNWKKGNVVEPVQLNEIIKTFHRTMTLSCEKFKNDRTRGYFDIEIGKLSFSDEDLLENLDAVLDKVREYNVPTLEKFVFQVNVRTEYSTLFILSEGLYLRVNSSVADSTGLV